MSGTTMDIDGLRKVADANRDVPEEAFDMRKWCGTACCLIGNFCKRNKKDKLKIDREFREPQMGKTIGFHAIQMRFGISLDDALHLFAYEHIQEAKTTRLARLEQFIKDHE